MPEPLLIKPSDCTEACQATLPEGWLSWLFLELKSYRSWYPKEPHKLLFEILGITLPIDLLLLSHGANTPSPLHNLPTATDADRIADFAAQHSNELQTDWHLCPQEVHRVRSFPKPGWQPALNGGNTKDFHLYLRRLSTDPTQDEESYRSVIAGVFCERQEPPRVLCDHCWARVSRFLEAPEKGPCHVIPRPAVQYRLPTDDLDWPGDKLARLVTASAGWFRATVASRVCLLPPEFDDEVAALLRALDEHAFSLAVAFDYSVLLEDDKGFGYFLTPQQERQISERTAHTPTPARDAAVAKQFLQGESFGGPEVKGLVHYVAERGYGMWSRDVCANKIYNGKSPMDLELGKLEDLIVHQPSRGTEQNFVFEAPVYVLLGKRQNEARRLERLVAVFFWVLPSRFSAPVTGLLLLASRLSVQQLAVGVDAAFGDRGRDEYLARRYNPLLLEQHSTHNYLQSLFPRTGPGASHFHNIRDFLRAPSGSSETKGTLQNRVRATRDLKEMAALWAYGDLRRVVRTLDNSTNSENALRWALTYLKMRVRVVEVGNEHMPYLLDVVHYLCGWHCDENLDGHLKDLTCLLGPGHKFNLNFLRKMVVRLTVKERSEKLPDDSPGMAEGRATLVAARDFRKVVAELENGGRCRPLWRKRSDPEGDPVHDPVQAEWATWASPKAEEVNEEDPGWALFSARVVIPRYESGGPPLLVFFRALLERIGEGRPRRLEMILDWPRDRFVIECLWVGSLKQRPPIQLWPPMERERREGGDLGIIRRKVGKKQWTGWFVALPLRYEEPPDDESEGENEDEGQDQGDPQGP